MKWSLVESVGKWKWNEWMIIKYGQTKNELQRLCPNLWPITDAESTEEDIYDKFHKNRLNVTKLGRRSSTVRKQMHSRGDTIHH